MRAYPLGLAFVEDLARVEAWAVAQSALTPRAPIALAACASMAVGVGLSVRGEAIDDVVREMERAAGRHSEQTAQMICEAAAEAENETPSEVTLDRLRGWAAHEAIAAAVYITLRHPDDPRAAILEGANTPGDSDSIATLVGAWVGARGGVSSLPEPWIRELERANELRTLAESLLSSMNRSA